MGILRYVFVITLLCSSVFANPKIRIVLDIDHMLVHPVVDEDMTFDAPFDLKLKDGVSHYYPAHGLNEFIASLVELPNVEISYFSTAANFRNEPLLKLIQLPGDTNAFDTKTGLFDYYNTVATMTEGKVTQPSKDMFPEFDVGGNVKKDLSVLEGFDPEWTIVIDNRSAHMLQGQEFSLLWIRDPFGSEFWERYPERVRSLTYIDDVDIELTLKSLVEKEDLEKAVHWSRAYYWYQNQLFYARTMLDRVLTMVREKGVTPVQALKKLQWHKYGERYTLNEAIRSDFRTYENAVQIFRRFNAQIDTVKIPKVKGMPCEGEIARFMSSP